MNKISEFLRIKKACVYLGVSPNTLRNTVDAEKIQAFPHPINSYRFFVPNQLDSILKDFNKAPTKKNKIASSK